MPLLEPLPEVKNLSQKVFERVREAILSGELAPGSRLVERRLAEDLEREPHPGARGARPPRRRGPRRPQRPPRLVGRESDAGRGAGGDLEPARRPRAVRRRPRPGALEQRGRGATARDRRRDAVGGRARRRRGAAAPGPGLPRDALGARRPCDADRAGGEAAGPDQQRPARRHAGAQPGRARGACRKPRRAPRRDRLGRAAAGAPGHGGPHHHGDETCPANARRPGTAERPCRSSSSPTRTCRRATSRSGS